MPSACPGPAPRSQVPPAICRPRSVRLERIAPEPLLDSAWLSSASRRNCRSMSLELLLNSSQPATTTSADDHQPHHDLAGPAREPRAEVPEEDDGGERGDARGDQARARAGAHERGGAHGHEEERERQPLEPPREEERAEHERPAEDDVGGEVVLVVEDAGDRVGLGGHRGEQARRGQADAEARLEDGEADDEGVAGEHRVAEPDETPAGAAGRRRREEHGGHRDHDGDVGERRELVRRPDHPEQQPREPEHGRQGEVLGGERHGVAAHEQVADAGVEDDGEHEAEEERLRHLRQGERRAEQGEQRQRDQQRGEHGADGGPREAPAAEDHHRRERDDDEQGGGGERTARRRRRDQRGQEGAAAEQRGVGGGEPAAGRRAPAAGPWGGTRGPVTGAGL